MTDPVPLTWRVLQPADLEVQKLGYSRSPWRIVHTPTGKELHWEEELYEPADGPSMMLRKPGYRTKAEAVDARERYLDQQTAALAELAHAAKAFAELDGPVHPGVEFLRMTRYTSRLEFP